MTEIKYQSIFIVITLTLMSVAPCNATKLKGDPLAQPLNIVREQLIERGISAYKAGYYPEAVSLIRDFLSHRRLIQTPIEKEGLIYLALAYQQVGESAQATETINRAISIANHSPLELAHLWYTAGIISQQQHQTKMVIAHWEQARHIYDNNHKCQQWTEITLKLAEIYQGVGNQQRYQELLTEIRINQIADH